MFFSKLVAGVPKHRTPKPKILLRRFAQHRVLHHLPVCSCSVCGDLHSPWVCCMRCYQVIKEETSKIKEKMVNYNPYLGQRQKTLQKL